MREVQFTKKEKEMLDLLETQGTISRYLNCQAFLPSEEKTTQGEYKNLFNEKYFHGKNKTIVKFHSKKHEIISSNLYRMLLKLSANLIK